MRSSVTVVGRSNWVSTILMSIAYLIVVSENLGISQSVANSLVKREPEKGWFRYRRSAPKKPHSAAPSKISSASAPSPPGHPILSSEPDSPIQIGGNTDEEKQRLVNEETLRIIRTEVLYLLNREKPPKHLHLNWQLLQRAKEAFIKVCPQVEVPKFFVNSLFRLFRYLYIHSKDANPYNHFFEEGPQSVRIADALDSCKTICIV